MINIAEYPYNIRARLTEEQYNKIKQSGMSDSDFIRHAIDCYDLELPRILETEKKDMLDEIRSVVVEQEASLQTQIVEQIVEQQHQLEGKIVELWNNCTTNKPVEIMDCGTNTTTKKHTTNNEALFMQILPTLQGLLHGEEKLTDKKLRYQARRIGVTTTELEDWMAKNSELLNGDEYLSR